MALLLLTSKERVKAFLEVGGKPWTAGDPLIDQLVTEVSGAIASYLGRADRLKSESRVEVFDVEPWQRVFSLQAYPVTSVTDVRHSATRDFASDTSIVDAANYAVNKRLGLLEFELYQLVAGPQLLQVTYTGGLAADTAALLAAAPEIALACELQIVYAVQRRNSLGGSAQSGGAGSTTFTEPFDLLPKVKTLLGPHRRVRFG